MNSFKNSHLAFFIILVFSFPALSLELTCKPLTPAISWQDSRATEVIKPLFEYNDKYFLLYSFYFLYMLLLLCVHNYENF